MPRHIEKLEPPQLMQGGLIMDHVEPAGEVVDTRVDPEMNAMDVPQLGDPRDLETVSTLEQRVALLEFALNHNTAALERGVTFLLDHFGLTLPEKPNAG